MPISEQLHERIKSTISSNDIVLFMKGTPDQPQCGFSAAVIEILNNLTPEYSTVNVLEDPDIREGIKEYSQWPTIPQLYVKQEFLGGCDIVKQLLNQGELHRALDLEPPERSTPSIDIDDASAHAIKQALEQQAGIAVHLEIDSAFNHQFHLGPPQGDEIVGSSNGVEILFDLMSAERANGLKLTMSDTPQGSGFNIQNPNAPAPVKELSPQQLKSSIDNGEELHLIDVREVHERDKAQINGSMLLDQQAIEVIGGLAKDAPLVFYCHHGHRSMSAAEYFRQQGHTDVANLTGGIDAWSLEVDPSVPRY